VEVAIVGDIAHSRVARSNILCLAKLGARVRLVAPLTLIPRGIELIGATSPASACGVVTRLEDGLGRRRRRDDAAEPSTSGSSVRGAAVLPTRASFAHPSGSGDATLGFAKPGRDRHAPRADQTAAASS